MEDDSNEDNINESLTKVRWSWREWRRWKHDWIEGSLTLSQWRRFSIEQMHQEHWFLLLLMKISVDILEEIVSLAVFHFVDRLEDGKVKWLNLLQIRNDMHQQNQWWKSIVLV